MSLPMSASSVEAARAALLRVIPSVFPWVRHLSAAEREEFAAELLGAMDDAPGRDPHADVHRTVVEWRATARVLAELGE
ncbi:hypothetical protein ACH5AO_28485 [Streptomyces sp. NPDC018964]|uniref:hypothetical protein n=1 Tax=unclassified Streptomyces TaxID=2593676 RepID=UPI0037BA67AE